MCRLLEAGGMPSRSRPPGRDRIVSMASASPPGNGARSLSTVASIQPHKLSLPPPIARVGGKITAPAGRLPGRLQPDTRWQVFPSRNVR